jgi:hypothetical protein
VRSRCESDHCLADGSSECLAKEWVSCVYTFYKPEVGIKTDKTGSQGHEFVCAKRGCTTKIMRWLDKGDA